MSLVINPAYFGPSVLTEQFDLTSLVYELDGSRRNLPMIQFRIPQNGRVFVTYRSGIDGGNGLSAESTGL